MKRKKSIQQLTLAAFFVAVQVIMTVTPIGYIPVGALSITTMHLPVILAGVLLGAKFGALTGFVFGLTSMLRATFQPSVSSVFFTPFVTVGGVSGNFWSLVIVFVPRILLGVLSAYMYQALCKRMNSVLACTVAAAVNTVIHTVLVLGLIAIFFGEQYAAVCGVEVSGLFAVLMGVVATNGVLEAVLAGIVVPALVRALKPSAERMGLVPAAAH